MKHSDPHPIELAVLACLVVVHALRPLLVALLALVLVLAGWKPKRAVAVPAAVPTPVAAAIAPVRPAKRRSRARVALEVA